MTLPRRLSPRLLAAASLLAAGLTVAVTFASTSAPRRAPEALPAVERALEVVVSPERPVKGTLFTVRVRAEPAAPLRVAGRFAEEPLHFRTAERSTAWAVAAVPVDAPDTLALALEVTWPDGRTETVRRTVAPAPGDYAMERLSVAPRFGQPMSEELQRRTAAEAARARAVARGAHDTPPLWDPGSFVRPRPGRVTSGFGNGREFNGQVQSRHMGTDLQGGTGAPVAAAGPGIVRLVDGFYLGGNVVYIDHGGGVSTGYLHLSETLVAEGDTVEAGQRIGSVGATGRVTGPHLHWILRYGSVTVDPLSLLALPPP